MINSIAELKKHAQEYVWELYVFNASGNPLEPSLPHKYLHKMRKVEHVQSKSLRLEGGSWLDWPKASETTFAPYLYNKNDVVMTIRSKTPNCPVLSYHLRHIASAVERATMAEAQEASHA